MAKTLPFLPYLLGYKEKSLSLLTIKGVKKSYPFRINPFPLLNSVRHKDFFTIITFSGFIVTLYCFLLLVNKNTIEDFPLKITFESLTVRSS